MIDVNQLLAPASEASPCGPDLEDDEISASDQEAIVQQRALYNLDALYSEARRAPAEEAPWSAVLDHAVDLLGSNKHLRVAVYLCEASLRQGQLRGLSQSLEVIRRMCETYWSDLHPLAASASGKQARVNILSGLGGSGFLAALRNMPVADGASGATLREFELMVEAGGDENTAAREFARSALGGQSTEALEGSLQLVNEVADHVGWISAQVDREYSPDDEVDCGDFLSEVDGQLIKKIESIRRILSCGLGLLAPEGATGPLPDDGSGTPAPARTGALSKDRIRQMLDQIIEYYQRNEPSSPVPLLLLRAKRSMDLGFIDLLSDTAGEDAVRKAQVILGVGKED